MGEKKPAYDATNNVTSRQGDIDVKCLQFSQPCRLEENDRVAKNGIATEDLSSPDYAILKETLVSPMSRTIR